MDDTGRVNVFEATQDLIQEVLDELLLERTAGEEPVKIGSEKFRNEVAIKFSSFLRVA